MLSYYFDIHIILVFSNEMLSIEEKCFYEHVYPSRVHGDQLYGNLILQTLQDKHDEITIWNFICCFDKKQRLYWLTKSKSCKIMSSLSQEVPHLDNNTKTNHMQSTLKNLKHAFKVNKLLHPNLNLKGEEKEKGIMSLKLADSDGNKRSLKPLYESDISSI